MPIQAKVIAHAFDSKNAIQYFPGDMVELDLTKPDHQELCWLHTPRHKWIFQFDRANASDAASGILFCKECGQPFKRLNELGTHDRSVHNRTKKAAELASADLADEADATLMALIAKQPTKAELQANEDRSKQEQREKLEMALEQQRKQREQGAAQ